MVEEIGTGSNINLDDVIPVNNNRIGLDKYWPLTSRDDVFLAIALGAVSPNAIEKLIPPVVTNTREWLLYMYGNGGFEGDAELVFPVSGDNNAIEAP